MERLQIIALDSKGPDSGLKVGSIHFRHVGPFSYCVGYRYSGLGSTKDPTNWKYDHTHEIIDDPSAQRVQDIDIPLERLVVILQYHGHTVDTLLALYCDHIDTI